MHCFTYGSRVIENEQQVRLHRNVRRIGNLLQAVVRVFVTFLLFALLNFLLSNLVQNAHLTFIKLFNIVQESAEVLFSQSVTALSIAYQHSFCLILAVAFSCVYQFGIVFKALGNGKNDSDKEKETYSKDSCEYNTETGDSTVSYRQKVCFLS